MLKQARSSSMKRKFCLCSVLKAGERCSRLIIFILFINTDERLLCTYDSIRNFARYMLHPKKICSFSFSVPPCLEVFKSNCVVTLNSNTGRTSQLRLLETGNLQHTNCRYNRVIHMHQVSLDIKLPNKIPFVDFEEYNKHLEP